MYVDTHCHLIDEKLADSKSVIQEFERYGITKAITMGCCADTSEKGASLSNEYKSVYFGSGVHPSDAHKFNNQEADRVVALLSHPKCVAVGEIGLDYYWEGYDKAVQKHAFITQLEIANEYRLPVSIHMRDATADTLEILKEHKPIYGGVLHCFAGSVETAKILINMGFYISFAGTLTFKNANKVLEVAKFLPDEFCLTETDSPFLAPHPYRGTVNTPKHIPVILEKLAQIKGRDMEVMARVVMQNALTLFPKLK